MKGMKQGQVIEPGIFQRNQQNAPASDVENNTEHETYIRQRKNGVDLMCDLDFDWQFLDKLLEDAPVAGLWKFKCQVIWIGTLITEISRWREQV